MIAGVSKGGIGEGDQKIVATLIAGGTGKAMGENAAAAKGLFDIGGW